MSDARTIPMTERVDPEATAVDGARSEAPSIVPTPPLGPREDLLQRLGLASDLAHVDEALTHASFANERRGGCADNQRLEFLGDAVLGLLVGEILMARFPSAKEGELSLLRSLLVSAEALAAWARAVGLGSSLRLGRGAIAAGERDRENVLADAAEALVGAVYLDRGLEAARDLATLVVSGPLAKLESRGSALLRDAKSELQERVQAAGGPSPRYRVVGAEGPDHRREFVVEVEVAGHPLARGRGRSKKLAEQDAARAALAAGITAPPTEAEAVPGNEAPEGDR